MESAQYVFQQIIHLKRQGRYHEAQKVLENTLNIYPTNVDLITQYIDVCYALNDYPPTLKWIHYLHDTLGGKLTPHHHMLIRHYIRRFADWSWYESELKWLKNHLTCGDVQPFYLFSYPLTLAEHNRAVRAFYNKRKLDQIPKNCFDFSNRNYKKRKIKVGFMSANWRNHPEMTQTLSFYRYLNSDKIQVYFYDLSPLNPTDLPYKEKVVQISPKTYKNVAMMNETQLANLIFMDQIDILVDVVGLTQGKKMGTFIQHPAPIQISWLAYPESMSGLPGYDYLIADSFVIPKDKKKDYPEQVLYLNPCYHLYDENSITEEFKVSRKDLNLPDHAFVYACAGQDYKLTPDYFQMWMRILKHVPNSVLWLYSINPKLSENLQAEAEKNGINKNRLIFFSNIEHQKYMSAIKCADLFLDTQYVNCHTTAEDVLFQGIPILTCPEKRWVGRVCGSILNAMKCKELIAKNVKEYEEKAIFWGTHPIELEKLKQKIQTIAKSDKFFNSQNYAARFEKLCLKLIKEKN